MPIASLRLIRRSFELAPQSEVLHVPYGTRGMYVLYRGYRSRSAADRGKQHFDVVYVGIAAGSTIGVRGRLQAHRRHKGEAWTHFSVFEVHENIRDDEVLELEGLFRHIYRYDARANRLNVAKRYAPLTRVRQRAQSDGWMDALSDLPRGRRA